MNPGKGLWEMESRESGDSTWALRAWHGMDCPLAELMGTPASDCDMVSVIITMT